MAIENKNSEKINDMLNRVFKPGTSRLYNRQKDGGYEKISATVNEIDKDQLLEIARTAQEVPNKCHIRRSGTQVTIYFA